MSMLKINSFNNRVLIKEYLLNEKNILSQLLVIGLLTISMTTVSAQSIQANEANDIDLEISTEDEKMMIK